MDQLILMKELETLKDLVAPVLDDNESGKPYLLDVFSNGACCNQFGDQYELRTILRH